MRRCAVLERRFYAGRVITFTLRPVLLLERSSPCPAVSDVIVLVRSIAFHLTEIDPSPYISYPRRLNTAVVLRILYC